MTNYPEEDPRNSSIRIPEIVEEMPGPALPPEEGALIDSSVFFINRTISEKALEAALMVGDYILTYFFNGDIEAAFSKDPNKPVSFSALCRHPDLRVSRSKLLSMVKVAAQNRFLMERRVDFFNLHYSHLEKLIRLPNNETKIDLVRQCTEEKLSTRQLGYRVRMRIIETGETNAGEAGPPEPEPAETILKDATAALEQLTVQMNELDLESVHRIIRYLNPEKRELLQNELMTFSDALNTAEVKCSNLLSTLQPEEGRY